MTFFIFHPLHSLPHFSGKIIVPQACRDQLHIVDLYLNQYQTAMKKIIFLTICLISSAVTLMAQTGFSYQAVLRNADGSLRANESLILDVELVRDDAAICSGLSVPVAWFPHSVCCFQYVKYFPVNSGTYTINHFEVGQVS